MKQLRLNMGRTPDTETEKAYGWKREFFEAGVLSTPAHTDWWPKSQVKIDGNWIIIPDWLARKRGVDTLTRHDGVAEWI
jgi:hypothetical protein